MSSHLKELIVVLGLAAMVFGVGKSICLTFMTVEDFKLRRNVWLILTSCAFLSPSFWTYACIALAVLNWAARRDSNPLGLYLIAYAIIPPIQLYLPVVGINQLFALDQARILSLVLLLPLALRLFMANEGGVARRWNFLDWVLVAYMVLQLTLVSPYESFTNTMRRGFLLSIDTVVVYYVFSRSIVTRRALVETMAMFTLAGCLYAAIAIFESLKGWLLYGQLGPDWNALNNGAFLMRGDSLRAQASAGHSLTLGYTLAMTFGFWLYLRSEVSSPAVRLVVTTLICVGLYATHSRGPWLTAVVVYFLYLILAPGGKSQAVKGVAVFASLAAVLAVTPVGARVFEMLPFVGDVDQGNVVYRQRIAEESWQLILQNPLFGDPFVTTQMEDLRQGQGIIDLMNAYAAVALFYGLVGAFLFVAFFLAAAGKAYATQRMTRSLAPHLSGVGAALIACILGSMFFMATASIDWIEYVLAGLLTAYVGMFARSRVDAPPQDAIASAVSPPRRWMTHPKS